MTPQAIRQAEVIGMSGGMGTACVAWTTVRSTHTELAAKLLHGSPSSVNGVSRLPNVLRHQVGRPALQKRQRPQAARVCSTTGSPGASPETPGPTASTVPAPSCPSTQGAGQSMVPSITEQSLWHRPAAEIRTATSPGPGSRTSSPVVARARSPSKMMPLMAGSIRSARVIGCGLHYSE